MLYAYTIDAVKKTFCQRQIVNCIKNIGFTNSVVANKTIYLGRKLQFAMLIILEICEAQFFEIHGRLR
jgi:hypothetical protein